MPSGDGVDRAMSHFFVMPKNMPTSASKETSMRYGEHLKKRREALGLSQEMVAQRVGLPLQTMIDIEENRPNGAVPTPAITRKLEKILGPFLPLPNRIVIC